MKICVPKDHKNLTENHIRVLFQYLLYLRDPCHVVLL